MISIHETSFLFTGEGRKRLFEPRGLRVAIRRHTGLQTRGFPDRRQCGDGSTYHCRIRGAAQKTPTPAPDSSRQRATAPNWVNGSFCRWLQLQGKQFIFLESNKKPKNTIQTAVSAHSWYWFPDQGLIASKDRRGLGMVKLTKGFSWQVWTLYCPFVKLQMLVNVWRNQPQIRISGHCSENFRKVFWNEVFVILSFPKVPGSDFVITWKLASRPQIHVSGLAQNNHCIWDVSRIHVQLAETHRQSCVWSSSTQYVIDAFPFKFANQCTPAGWNKKKKKTKRWYWSVNMGQGIFYQKKIIAVFSFFFFFCFEQRNQCGRYCQEVLQQQPEIRPEIAALRRKRNVFLLYSRDLRVSFAALKYILKNVRLLLVSTSLYTQILSQKEHLIRIGIFVVFSFL